MTRVISLDTAAEFDAFVAQPGPRVVEFWADWCDPCKKLSPILDAIAADNPQIAFAKVNADVLVEVATEERVSSLPMTLVYKDGQKVDYIGGAKSRPAFEADLTKSLAS